MKLELYLKYRDIWNRFAGKGIYPHELAFLLDNPLRKYIISPDKLSEYLHLQPGSRVLEIGSGPGYFSSSVARNIPQGQLILFDIQMEMLKKCSIKLSKNQILNRSFVQGDAIFLPFHENSFDIVFMVTVLGEISSPTNCIKRIHSILKPGGILSITEMKGDPDLLSVEELNTMLAESGYKFYEQYKSAKGYTLNYIKKISI